jgi:hypothetical protein
MNEKWNSESRMRKNRLSGLMRGGSQTVIGHNPFQSVGSCLLYTGSGCAFSCSFKKCGTAVRTWICMGSDNFGGCHVNCDQNEGGRSTM